MTTAHKVTAVLAGVLFLLLCFAGYGLIQEHDNQIRSEDAKNAANAQMQADAAKETANQKQLAATVAAFAAAKQTVVTPAQIVKELPTYITLPAPITQVQAAPSPPAPSTTVTPSGVLPDPPKPIPVAGSCKVGDLVIPSESAKSFFDSQVDCKQNAAIVVSQKQTIANQQDDNTALKKENAALITQNKGGTKWQRTLSAGKWFAVGSAAGVIAGVVAAHH